VLVASPAYLAEHGDPKSLAALESHRAILYGHRETDWRFESPAGARVVRRIAGLRINNGMFIRAAVLAGLGIALVPAFIVANELRSGVLRALDVGFEPEGAQLFIAYPRNRTASAKIQALTRHLRQTFGDPPYWEKLLE
jgi:DNA-binding transcriptional LysR family regulator